MKRNYTYTLSLLIKVGQEKHIDQLQQTGLIHSKTVKYFREQEIEEIELRRDNREGAKSSIRIKDLKLLIDNKELPLTFQKGRFNTFDPDLDLTHIYCLYAVTPDLADGQSFIDERVSRFGDTALLITDPGEFIKRVENAIKDKYECTYRPVQYYPDTNDYTQLTVFDKPDSLNFQREFRFHFEHIDKNNLEFEIGSLKDISLKIESKKLSGLTMKNKEE